MNRTLSTLSASRRNPRQYRSFSHGLGGDLDTDGWSFRLCGYRRAMTGHDLLGGRYELRAALGYGGMAEVYDGWDTRLHRSVAIKLLHPALDAQPDIRSRFVAEARTAAGLTHPNIVAVHDFGEHDGIPFMVMERLSGRSLENEMERGPLPSARVRSILDDVLAALEVAHSAGILHRDIKPGNVLSSPEAMKVADFGIAKTVDVAHTLTGQLFGTMAYMSPERLAGAPATVSDDLYAVGIVGYEVAAGRRLFPQTDLATLAAAVMGGGVPSLHTVRPDIDATLAATIDRAMARDPALRFTSAHDMRAALHGRIDLLGPEPVVGQPRPRVATKMFTTPVPYVTPNTHYASPHSRRGGRTRAAKILIGSAILLALIVTALAFAMDQPSRQSPAPPVTSTTATTTSSTTTTPPTTAAPVQPPDERGNGNGNGNRKPKKHPG